jgi:hypothetical protein
MDCQRFEKARFIGDRVGVLGQEVAVFAVFSRAPGNGALVGAGGI